MKSSKNNYSVSRRTDGATVYQITALLKSYTSKWWPRNSKTAKHHQKIHFLRIVIVLMSIWLESPPTVALCPSMNDPVLLLCLWLCLCLWYHQKHYDYLTNGGALCWYERSCLVIMFITMFMIMIRITKTISPIVALCAGMNDPAWAMIARSAFCLRKVLFPKTKNKK